MSNPMNNQNSSNNQNNNNSTNLQELWSERQEPVVPGKSGAGFLGVGDNGRGKEVSMC